MTPERLQRIKATYSESDPAGRTIRELIAEIERLQAERDRLALELEMPDKLTDGGEIRQ